MLTLTSVEAQDRVDELIDGSQREPVQITRCRHLEAYVICVQNMRTLTDLRTRCEAASCWYEQYRHQLAIQPEPVFAAVAALTDADVAQLVTGHQ